MDIMYIKNYVYMLALFVIMPSLAMLPGHVHHHNDTHGHRRLIQDLRSGAISPTIAYQEGTLNADFLLHLIYNDDNETFWLICNDMDEESASCFVELMLTPSSYGDDPFLRLIELEDIKKLSMFLPSGHHERIQKVLVHEVRMCTAVLYGDVCIVEKLCDIAQEHGILDQVLQARDDNGRTPLMLAIGKMLYNAYAICEYAHQAGVLSNVLLQRDIKHCTPLHMAILFSNEPVSAADILCKKAYEHGMCAQLLQAQVYNSWNCLVMALYKAWADERCMPLIDMICRYAVRADALSHLFFQRNAVNEKIPLHMAAELSPSVLTRVCDIAYQHGILAQALQEQTGIGQQGQRLHYNALMVAIETTQIYPKNRELIKTISGYAHQVGVLSQVFLQRDNLKRTPLQMAISFPSARFIVDLICTQMHQYGLLAEVLQCQGGMDVNGRELRRNALATAIGRAEIHLVRIICSYAVQANILSQLLHQYDANGKTPLEVAARCGGASIVKFLCHKAQVYHVYADIAVFYEHLLSEALDYLAYQVDNGCKIEETVSVMSVLYEEMQRSGVWERVLQKSVPQNSTHAFCSYVPLIEKIIDVAGKNDKPLRALCKSAYNAGTLRDLLTCQITSQSYTILRKIYGESQHVLPAILQDAAKQAHTLSACLDVIGEKSLWRVLSQLSTYEARKLIYRIIARVPHRYSFLEDADADADPVEHQPRSKGQKRDIGVCHSSSGQAASCIRQSADMMGSTPLHISIALYNQKGNVPMSSDTIRRQLTSRDCINNWTPRDIAADLSLQGNGKTIYDMMSGLVDPCPICLTPLDQGNIQTFTCSHTFHTSCIQRHRQYQDTCPCCRQPIT